MTTLTIIRDWFYIIATIVAALSGLCGVIWWMSAVYSEIKNIGTSLNKITGKVDFHEERLNHHGFRLNVIEDKLEIEPREVV